MPMIINRCQITLPLKATDFIWFLLFLQKTFFLWAQFRKKCPLPNFCLILINSNSLQNLWLSMLQKRIYRRRRRNWMVQIFDSVLYRSGFFCMSFSISPILAESTGCPFFVRIFIIRSRSSRSFSWKKYWRIQNTSSKGPLLAFPLLVWLLQLVFDL